jgi:hypothetical protein
MEIVRTHFAPKNCGKNAPTCPAKLAERSGKIPARNSELSKLPKKPENLSASGGKYRLEPFFVKENFFVSI